MIKKANDMVKELREHMRDGKGTVEINHIYKQNELATKCRLCAKIVLNPNCSIGTHAHVDEEEIYYILKGKGVVIDDGIPQEVTVGDAILTGNGAEHSIENIGDEPLEMMAIVMLY